MGGGGGGNRARIRGEIYSFSGETRSFLSSGDPGSGGEEESLADRTQAVLGALCPQGSPP